MKQPNLNELIENEILVHMVEDNSTLNLWEARLITAIIGSFPISKLNLLRKALKEIAKAVTPETEPVFDPVAIELEVWKHGEPPE